MAFGDALGEGRVAGPRWCRWRWWLLPSLLLRHAVLVGRWTRGCACSRASRQLVGRAFGVRASRGGGCFFRAARGGSQPSRGGFSGLWAPCPARDRRARVLEERRRGGLGRSSKGHSAGCWFVSVQEPGAAAVVGRGGGGALYAPDLPTLGASGREGRSFSLVRCSAAARHHTRTGMPNEACLSEQTS